MDNENDISIVGSNIIIQYDALIKNYIDQKLQELKEEILTEINGSDTSV